MLREILAEQFLPSKNDNYILMLPTGYGKTKLSLDKAKQWVQGNSKILIVVYRLVNINEWLREIKKWKHEDLLSSITFTTYSSLPKYCSPEKHWDVIIFDEGHHTSPRCQSALRYVNVSHVIVLSATLKKDLVKYFSTKFHAESYKINLKEAILDEVLPDPKIILIPLTLDNTTINQVIEKNKKNSSVPIKTIGYIDKWKYRQYKGHLRILCTQQQYYNEISALIDWYKRKSRGSAAMRNLWLHKAGERLKWLANQKEDIIKKLLKALSSYRTLTYCPSIAESSIVGKYCINSEVGTDNLTKFNDKKIKHITAVGMLDEGEIAPISI